MITEFQSKIIEAQQEISAALSTLLAEIDATNITPEQERLIGATLLEQSELTEKIRFFIQDIFNFR
jgi:hypothetical protein